MRRGNHSRGTGSDRRSRNEMIISRAVKRIATGTGSCVMAREVLIPFMFNATSIAFDNPANLAYLILPEALVIGQGKHFIQPKLGFIVGASNVNGYGFETFIAEEVKPVAILIKDIGHGVRRLSAFLRPQCQFCEFCELRLTSPAAPAASLPRTPARWLLRAQPQRAPGLLPCRQAERARVARCHRGRASYGLRR